MLASASAPYFVNNIDFPVNTQDQSTDKMEGKNSMERGLNIFPRFYDVLHENVIEKKAGSNKYKCSMPAPSVQHLHTILQLERMCSMNTLCQRQKFDM